MQFIFAQTLFDSIERLDPRYYDMVSGAIVRYKNRPEHPGFHSHRLDGITEKNFWSARVNDDIRLIIYRDDANTVVCYADHHDAAYDWAARRRYDVNRTTGAAHFVAIEERLEEVTRRITVTDERGPALFAQFGEEYLLALGIPDQWLHAVRNADETQFTEQLLYELPEEASEALFQLANGNVLPTPVAAAPAADPFSHPDARRRFRVINDDRALQQALAEPWNKWTIFLHPMQQEIVDRNYSGPARVTGGAGTGKTVVALHRAARLAQQDPDVRILLTTFSRTLAARLQQNLHQLIGDDAPELERITVMNLHNLAAEMQRDATGQAMRIITDQHLSEALTKALESVDHGGLSPAFLKAEWGSVVSAESISSWEQYREFPRVGRGTPLGIRQRLRAWKVFEALQQQLDAEQLSTYEQLCHATAKQLADSGEQPFDHVIADEVQDFGPAGLRLLSVLAGQDGNLFLCGDLGQRIYKGPTSFLGAGIDLRGRSSRLHLNYRTTEQIRRYADRLLPAHLEDPDSGGFEARDSVSLLTGPEPEVVISNGPEEEIQKVTAWLKQLISRGHSPSDIAIFARTNKLVEQRARNVVGRLGLQAHLLSDAELPLPKQIAVGTMHRAKGLEFRVVVVMGCEEKYLPNQYVLSMTPDAVARELAIEQESSLFYVACTRARERLLVSCGGKASPFLV